ncbi:ABC transporter ATP-binding protein [Hoeflea prorocentri]|uniref:ABC transporter ATP-binding protein n=1 Tax=Hoeflea prorocentri TaxID=1922333 RepID=A0A9X3ULP7_9HYPH|nr:ABC transporter ATP-binding protein [Hoeflea prorocentri]MCY6383063.1 ABC transporter ATP-binding protein [Hoeflea prorocentri]MDA5400863.1 ABC transporter ATP-binding protein [Hoeflea prorocentri]
MLRRILSENGRDYIGTYAFAITCLVAISMSTAFLAWILKDIVDEAFARQRADVIWWITAGIFAAFVVRGAATYGQAVALAQIGNNIVARYQRRLFSHLMELGVGYLGETRSAQLAARIGQNASGIRDVLNLTVTSLAKDLLTLVALVGVMFYQDWVLTLAVFLVGPPVVVALRYISKRLRAVTREAVLVNSRVYGVMQETMQGIAIVKAFTMEDQLRHKVDYLVSDAEARSNRIVRLTERTGPLTDSLAGLAVAGILAYAASQTINSNELPGALVSFIGALLFAYDPARRLAKLQVNMERAIVNARMIYEVLDIVPHQPDAPGAKAIEISGGEIRFEHVSFGYAETSPVLHDVSFVAEAGKTTALVGPSGAGKTTIVNLLPRFYDLPEGRILIDGQDIGKVTKHSLRAGIAYVSQHPYLFEGTIRDNIRYGRPDASDAEVEEAARLAFAHDFILEQPEGYETPIGEGGSTLSGGQRQRLSIARALIRNAPILLLDEATSALDTESEVLVQKALDEAMSGRTVLVIAHRLSTIARADRIVVMMRGKVTEQGTHAELAAMDGGIYARFLKLQALGLDGSEDLGLERKPAVSEVDNG